MRMTPNPTSRQVTGKFGILFLFLGISLLVWPIIAYGVGAYSQFMLHRRWQSAQESHNKLQTTYYSYVPPPVKLIIPSINLDAMVLEGVTTLSLSRGPGHLTGTALPGRRGNCCIAGHRNMYGAWFQLLDRLSPGDSILLCEPNVIFEYRVTGRSIVLPNDIGILNPTIDPTLTLITCTPIPKPTHRLAITARLIKRWDARK
jgi:sortase A